MKTSVGIKSGNYFEKGDILLAKITPSFENGKQGIALEIPNEFGVASTELIPIKEKKDISNKYFLFYYLLEGEVRKQLAEKMEGTTGRQRIPISVLKECSIPFPPLEEQKKISAVLFKLQKAIEIQEKIIETTRELKKATMQHVFTYGLKGEKTKETDIGRIPESWESRPLGSFCKVIMGQSPEGEYYNKSGNGVPLLNGPAAFTEKYPVAVQWTTNPTKLAEKDDILFCVRGNTVARMNIADQDYCIGRGIAAIHGLADRSITRFLFYLIEYNTERIYSHATAGGSTFPNFSKTDFNFIRVQGPIVSEQIEIAEILQTIDQKIELHVAKKSALQDLFKTILNKLMTGEIRVKDLKICVNNMMDDGLLTRKDM